MFGDEIARKFHQEVTGSKPTKALIGQAIREGVCRRSLFAKQEISLSVFSQSKVFACRGHFKELKLKGILSH